jgi:RND superfamily putative drug exporter
MEVRSVQRFSGWVLAHRLVVVLLWLMFSGAGVLTVGRTVDSLSYEFGLPGQPAYAANTAILDTYGGGGLTDPIVLTVRAPGGTDLRTAAARQEFAAAAQGSPRPAPAAAPGW